MSPQTDYAPRIRIRKYLTSVFMSIEGIICTISYGTYYAYAVPPEPFPNINNYSALTPDVTIKATDIEGKTVIIFTTPEHITCYMGAEGAVTCFGHYKEYLPFGINPVDKHQCLSYAVDLSSQTNDYTSSLSPGEDESCTKASHRSLSYNLLTSHKKITYSGATCGEGDQHILACTNGRHSFVLQLGNSWFN